jgi:hypothetical protein
LISGQFLCRQTVTADWFAASQLSRFPALTPLPTRIGLTVLTGALTGLTMVRTRGRCGFGNAFHWRTAANAGCRPRPVIEPPQPVAVEGKQLVADCMYFLPSAARWRWRLAVLAQSTTIGVGNVVSRVWQSHNRSSTHQSNRHHVDMAAAAIGIADAVVLTVSRAATSCPSWRTANPGPV